MKYDVIIVGSGIGGLTAGLRLALNGKKVAVFEKHYIPGGYATNFSRKGKNGNVYTFDCSLHSLSGAYKDCTVYNIFDNLKLLDKISIITKKNSTTILRNGEFFTILSNPDEFCSTLCKRYPNFKNGIKDLFNFMEVFYEDMKIISTDYEASPQYMLDLQSISFDNFIRRYVDNDDFMLDFGYLWGYIGLPPSKVSAFYFMTTFCPYVFGGHSYIKGGSGQLSKVIAKCIENNKGKIYLSSEITKVNTKNDKVISVTTKKGDTFEADEFIFACDPNHIFSLIDNPIINDYLENIENLEKSTSITQLFLGLDCSTKDLGINYTNVYIQKTDFETSFNESLKGNIKNTNGNIAFYDQMDPTLNKHGASVHITSIDYEKNWPERGTKEYKQRKEEITKILLDKLLSIYPQIEGHIQVIELGTPKTMARYTNNSSGSIYGWAQNINQSGLNRSSFKTPFKNAIIVGAWSFPGGGYEGVLFGGMMGANRILSKSKSNESSSNGLVPINLLMKGLISKFNPENAEGIDITYKFLFDGYDPIYLEIKNKTAKLLSESETPEKIDTTLSMTHETWYKIAFNEISGQDALMDGLVKCEGNLRNFASMSKFFDKNLISIDTIMTGLISKFNPENAKGIDITYKFIFEEYDPIYLQVKNQTARLLPKSETPEKIDTTLSMSHETWYKIAFNEITGQDALMDGLVKCEGNLRNFASMPNIFNKVLK